MAGGTRLEMVRLVSGSVRTSLKERHMSSTRFLVAAVAAVALLSTAAGAGTMFRLEIGSSAALRTGLKDKNAKKVIVAVRAVVCEDLHSVKITATAEGLVNGKRQTHPVTPTVIDQAEAVYAIQQQWPQDGAW